MVKEPIQSVMKKSISARLEYIDGLKVIMIFCVLLCHLPGYSEIEPSHLWPELGGAGVSGFIILSGFGLTYGLLTKNVTNIRVIPFLRQRFLRILPLYYAAIFTYLLILDLMQPANFLAHLLLVHTFFKELSHNPGSFWFVGLIVQCYLFFPFAYKILLKNKGLFVLNISAICLYILGILLAALGLYVADSFLSFVIEFVLSINIAVNAYTKKMNQYIALPIIIFTAIELTCFIISMKTSFIYDLSDYVRQSITTFSRICFFMIFLNVFLLLEQHWENYKRLVTVLSAMGFASYSVYLFHRPLLTILIRGSVWNWFFHQISSKDLKFIALAVVSFPLIFLIIYWIQTAHDSLQKNFFFTQFNSSRNRIQVGQND